MARDVLLRTKAGSLQAAFEQEQENEQKYEYEHSIGTGRELTVHVFCHYCFHKNRLLS
jgi:hypothetical protein